jgi:hypothetical protein
MIGLYYSCGYVILYENKTPLNLRKTHVLSKKFPTLALGNLIIRTV